MFINRLLQTYLIQSDIPEDIEVGVKKIKAGYPNSQHYVITIFKQSDTETIVQIFNKGTLNGS